MDNSKASRAARYRQLVENVKATYKERETKVTPNGKVKLVWHDDCKEINLWTYWQGLDYAETVPDVKIMIVGQDFGNPYGIFAKGNRLNDIYRDNSIHYLAEIPSDNIAPTDANLVKLFKKVLGKNINIDKERYPGFFFTNFCLGYRTDNSSGGMTLKMMNDDASFFVELCDIVRPEKIICLGRITYEAVVRALTKQKPKIKGYNKYIADRNYETYSIEDYTCHIYPSAHTGYFGVMNRDKKNRLDTVVEDWKSYLD